LLHFENLDTLTRFTHLTYHTAATATDFDVQMLDMPLLGKGRGA